MRAAGGQRVLHHEHKSSPRSLAVRAGGSLFHRNVHKERRRDVNQLAHRVHLEPLGFPFTGAQRPNPNVTASPSKTPNPRFKKTTASKRLTDILFPNMFSGHVFGGLLGHRGLLFGLAEPPVSISAPFSRLGELTSQHSLAPRP